MKNCLLVIFAFMVSGFAYSQTAKTMEAFAKVSAEQVEAGKVIYVVDMTQFNSDSQKSLFLESVYGSSKVFATSVVREDNTLLVCGIESVINKDDAIILLNTYRQQALTSNLNSSGTVDKHKTK